LKDWCRSYVVTLLGFVGLVPAFVPLLSNRGVCCKSLIGNKIVFVWED